MCVTFSNDMTLFVKGDVYPVESNAELSVNQVLDAHWGVLNDEDVRNLIACLSFIFVVRLYL